MAPNLWKPPRLLQRHRPRPKLHLRPRCSLQRNDQRSHKQTEPNQIRYSYRQCQSPILRHWGRYQILRRSKNQTCWQKRCSFPLQNRTSWQKVEFGPAPRLPSDFERSQRRNRITCGHWPKGVQQFGWGVCGVLSQKGRLRKLLQIKFDIFGVHSGEWVVGWWEEEMVDLDGYGSVVGQEHLQHCWVGKWKSD